MKKKLVSLTLGLLLIVFASLESYAEIREHIGNMGKGFQDEGTAHGATDERLWSGKNGRNAGGGASHVETPYGPWS